MTEQKIKESEEKYRQIIKHLDLGYFKTDVNGIILEHNPAVNKILGFELDESLVGLSAKDFFGSIEEYNKFQKEMTKKGRLSSFIHSARNKIGDTIFLHVNSHVYKNKEKNRLEVEGTVFDVTEKLVLEQKLKESEKKYRNIIENSKDAIVIIGLDAKFKYISPQLSKMVGKEYNVDTKLLTDVHPDDINSLEDILSYALKNRDVGTFGDFEFRALHHDGHYIWFSCSANNYYDEDGTVIGFIILVRDVTDKKEAEQKLKESEEKHRSILDKLEQGYYEVNLKGNYTFVNKFHANYFGYTKDEFIGKSYRNFFDEETGKRIFNTYNEIYRKNLPKGIIELETVRPDEVRHIFEASIYLKRDSNGKKIGFYGTTYDISERKKWEQHIQESEEKYRLITENANDMIVVLNEKFEYEYINEKVHMERMGFSKKDIIGKSALDFIHPNDIKKAANLLKDGFKIGEGGGEVRVRRKKGDYLLLDVRGKIFTDKEGNRKGLLISRDITERKIAEQKLRESEKKYHDLFNSTPYAIWLVDLNGVLIDCNTTMNKFMTVFKKEDLIGKNFSEVIRLFSSKGDSKFEKLSSVFKEGFKFLLKQGYIDPFEFQITRADGKELWITLESSLVYVGNEKFIQIFIKDITERKEAELRIKQSEKELRNLNLELEEKVRERTKELEEKNIELKKLDQAKDDFITMAAHELKTPLISVAGYTDYILTKYIDELSVDVKNDLLIVQRNIDRLQSLMNQLLDVMKIESHKIKLNFQLTNVSNIIYRCLHELNYLFKEKHHEMVLNIDNEIFINIDPNRIFQVFSNLISNSTKYTPKGGKIEISAKKDVMHYLFEVKDNGIGLSEENLDRIFEKFETVKNGNESFQTGSGLGLYISKGFVDAHGGQIWATSEGLNKGMTIHFTIPT
ncbi:MAG: PAS domain S-box protein [Candidatus Thorarchaeota archaeon]